jgi:hypothetical protein
VKLAPEAEAKFCEIVCGRLVDWQKKRLLSREWNFEGTSCGWKELFRFCSPIWKRLAVAQPTNLKIYFMQTLEDFRHMPMPCAVVKEQ